MLIVYRNKGHEVMAYLSYIIDHYNNLSDVNIFLHSHRYAWHNNDLLGGDAVQMVKRLSAERVQREGFMYVLLPSSLPSLADLNEGTCGATGPQAVQTGCIPDQ